MKKFFFIILFAIAFSSFGQEKSNKRIKIDKSKIAFIKYDKNWNYPFKNAKPTEITENELQEIEKILVECTVRSEMLSPLKKYYRQYVIVVNENDEKEVWINFMCKLVSPDFIDWKKELIETADGGSCYFNVKINLSTKTCYDLMINMQG